MENILRINNGILVECLDKKELSIIIPDTVSHIGDLAFDECTKLISIMIPDTVTSIGNCAFLGCKGLTLIICNALTPPILYSNVFFFVTKNIPLYVPIESVELYKNTDQWKEFNVIGINKEINDNYII